MGLRRRHSALGHLSPVQFEDERGRSRCLVRPHPVGVATDVDVAMARQSVAQRRSHDVVVQHRAPLLEALVRRQHGRRVLVAGVDQLEEPHRALSGDGQVADLVGHHQRRMRQHAPATARVAGGLRLGQRPDQPASVP